MADTPATLKVLELAKIRFVDDISPAEKKLFEATEKGEWADCGGDSGERGVIRSDRLSWLCTDPDAAARVTYRGILIVDAEIDGGSGVGVGNGFISAPELANIELRYKAERHILEDLGPTTTARGLAHELSGVTESNSRRSSAEAVL